MKRSTLFQSLVPVILLIGLILCNVVLLGDDTLSGANQLALLLAAAAGAAIALYNRVSWNGILHEILGTLNSAMPAILILLMIGMLSGMWMMSGIIPAMIYYGLNLLSPDFFLPAAVLISVCISLAVGSSWSTIATIGVALLGIGRALGFSDGIVAGAIISGAYFGDKVSPLSDTTNLASAVTGTPLFTHIRYMLTTTVPTLLLTLAFFVAASFLWDTGGAVSDVGSVRESIASVYRITPFLFIVPAAVVVLIAKKVPAIPVLLIGALLGTVFALVFQPDVLASLTPDGRFTAEGVYRVLARGLYGRTEMHTPDPELNALLTTGGMAGMLNTVWLILTAMVFGGVMEAGKFLERLTAALLGRVRSTGGLVTAASGTCILFNLTAGDQYMSIVIPGKMYAGPFRRAGLRSEVLSRTLEDSATVTSVLVPWNTCGATQASILGVATTAYLPFAVFCYLSPLMTITYAWFNIKIRRQKDETMDKESDRVR